MSTCVYKKANRLTSRVGTNIRHNEINRVCIASKSTVHRARPDLRISSELESSLFANLQLEGGPGHSTTHITDREEQALQILEIGLADCQETYNA